MLNVNFKYSEHFSHSLDAFFSHFWPTIKVGAVMSGNYKMLFTSLVFWLGLVLIPTTVLLLDVTVKA